MSKKERQARFYKKHRKRLIKERTLRKKKIRTWVRGFKGKSKCARCGFSHPAALQFHHRNPETKKFDIGSAVSMGQSIQAIQKEISKCDILCANCHCIEHFQGFL